MGEHVRFTELESESTLRMLTGEHSFGSCALGVGALAPGFRRFAAVLSVLSVAACSMLQAGGGNVGQRERKLCAKPSYTY